MAFRFLLIHSGWYTLNNQHYLKNEPIVQGGMLYMSLILNKHIKIFKGTSKTYLKVS